MKTVDALIAARNVIADINNWTRGYMYAHRKPGTRGRGRMTALPSTAGPVLTEKTNCFCALGALGKVFNVRHPETTISLVYEDTELRSAYRAVEYLRNASRQLFGKPVFQVNDNSEVSWTEGHANVLAVYDLAIKNAKRRHINGDRKKS